jgi:hypothetical protein
VLDGLLGACPSDDECVIRPEVRPADAALLASMEANIGHIRIRSFKIKLVVEIRPAGTGYIRTTNEPAP